MNKYYRMVKIKVGDSMAMTKLMNENEENINGAIKNGISGEAVGSTLEDVVNKADEIGNAKQIKKTVETIVDMKENNNTKVDESYASNLVKNNSEKIEAAINEGITPKEVATTLVNETNKTGKTHLPFVVQLISKMKKRELKLNMEKQDQMIKKQS